MMAREMAFAVLARARRPLRASAVAGMVNIRLGLPLERSVSGNQVSNWFRHGPAKRVEGHRWVFQRKSP